MRPDGFNTGTPEQSQAICVRLVREQNCKTNWLFVEAAVIVQLPDCLAHRVPAVRVLRLDQRETILHPRVRIDRSDLACGHVLLAPDKDAFGCHVVAVPEDELLLGSLRGARLSRRADNEGLGVLLFDVDVVHHGFRLGRLDGTVLQPCADRLRFCMQPVMIVHILSPHGRVELTVGVHAMFTFGLDRVLDGIETLIENRRRGRG